MGNISKHRRQDIIYQKLKGKDESSALSIREIQNGLKIEGIDICSRTIRRDLLELSNSHGLLSTSSWPEKFYPSKDFNIKYQIKLNESTLQVLLIALNNLKFTSHDYFKDFAAEAETAILANMSEEIARELRASKERYFFDFSISGKPSQSNLKDFEKVMIAIRENKLIKCKNDSPYKNKEYNSITRIFAPYLFVLTSGIPYLIVEDQKDKQFKKLRMTRLKDVKISTKSFEFKNISDDINLKNLMGGWGGILEETASIKIICDDYMATYFKEKIIHKTQKIKKLKGNKFEISFQCAKSSELARLISSFGGHVESIHPENFNQEVLEIWENGLKKIA